MPSPGRHAARFPEETPCGAARCAILHDAWQPAHSERPILITMRFRLHGMSSVVVWAVRRWPARSRKGRKVLVLERETKLKDDWRR
jgi:hypothetical protein